MGDTSPASPSLPPSEPPDPQSVALGAAALASHPVWAAARGGRGRGAGRGGARGGRGTPPMEAATERPRYERISLQALERQQYADADGAESHLNSDDEEAFEAPPRRERAAAAANGGDSGPSEDEDDAEERPSRRQRLDGILGAAAFGGGAPPRQGPASESAASQTSTQRRRDANKEAFPIRGISCVGCALANRVGPVDKFVRTNISRMTEESLFKMAALTYKREVAEPTEREGAPVPAWAWKDVRAHYTLHCSSNLIGRHVMIRQLQSMRAQLETRLVRCENDEREIDRGTADLLLKTIQQESRERALLEAAIAPGKQKS